MDTLTSVVSVFGLYVAVGGVLLALCSNDTTNELVEKITPVLSLIVWPYILWKRWVR